MKIQHDKEVLIGWKELAERDGIKGLITNSNRGGWQIISYDSSKWRIPADHKQTFLHNSGFMAVYETLEDLLEIHYKPTK